MATGTAVSLEVGKRKVFAWAHDWPGWCRAAKTEELALAALADYVPRYAEVAEEAGLRFPKTVGNHLEVVERVPGNATTEFGVPGELVAQDREPLTKAQAARITKLVAGAWAVFDRVVAVTPAELRKGPRGGGRDRDKMVAHVLGAEAAYARKLGIRHPEPALGDAASIATLRGAIAGVLGQASDGTAPTDKGWPPRYAARRIAWHVLDHVWEMQDRSQPAG